LAFISAQAVVRRRERAGLMPRQHEIVVLVAEGLVTKQIARRLWLSPATVRNHVAAILTALEAHSWLEAVAKASRLGLLPANASVAGPHGRDPTRGAHQGVSPARGAVRPTRVR
jgi:DNA-binding CsgD family transcriptional regulator